MIIIYTQTDSFALEELNRPGIPFFGAKTAIATLPWLPWDDFSYHRSLVLAQVSTVMYCEM